MINIDFHPLLGGAQMHTLRLCRYLLTQGVDVQVITRSHPGLPAREIIDGVAVYRTPILHPSKIIASLSFTFFALRELYARREHYQIVHCHEMLSPMTTGLLAKSLLKRRIVINPHRGGYLGDVYKLTHTRPMTGGLRLKWVRAQGDVFIAVSREIAGELTGCGIAKEKIRFIPYILDTDHFRPAKSDERQALRAGFGKPDEVWACFAGRLVEEKGLNLLLQAFDEIARTFPQARLMLLGEGDQRAALEAQTNRLGLQKKVRFVGAVEDTAPYLRACDLYVQPSFTEGLPIAMLEAMACELPTLATAVGGVTDLLCDEQNGLVIPAHDVERLTAQMGRLFASAELRAALGRPARQDVVKYCAIERVGQAHMALYRQLAETFAATQEPSNQSDPILR
jgi:glycosyltransferase involved in cell wall biosynthesis